MSVMINHVTTVELPDKGAYLANVVGDEVYIYPQGLGRGPTIMMSKKDWARIQDEVRRAWMRADRQAPS